MIQYSRYGGYQKIQDDQKYQENNGYEKSSLRKRLIFLVLSLPWILTAIFATTTAILLLGSDKLAKNSKFVEYLGWETDFSENCIYMHAKSDVPQMQRGLI
jgi:hypothetical protein